MSSDLTAISVDGLGKQFRLGTRGLAYRTLRESLTGIGRGGRTTRETMWALRDITFDVRPGEAVGVIGANGAGKTTLLKILSRITEPTEGEARVRGRVGALLEVGTGFHPELTGRENVYLNGAILGMSRREIATKFDDIISFAGVEKFVDTPVKRYSSGMYVRLAFAVAAHLDCDILLVDEVLSVGDFGFQRRSLGKMQEQTQQEGRTVLFVSHNLGAVKTLTTRCVWLEQGRVREYGPTDEVFRNFVLSHGETSAGRADLSDMTVGRPRGKELPHDISFEWVELTDGSGRIADVHFAGEPMTVRVGFRVNRQLPGRSFDVRCRLSTLEGQLLFSSMSLSQAVPDELGVYTTGFTLDPNPLESGVYTIELYAVTLGEDVVDMGQDLIRSALTFRIEDNPTGDNHLRDRRGLIRVDYPWTAVERFAEDPRNPLTRLA